MSPLRGVLPPVVVFLVNTVAALLCVGAWFTRIADVWTNRIHYLMDHAAGAAVGVGLAYVYLFVYPFYGRMTARVASSLVAPALVYGAVIWAFAPEGPVGVAVAAHAGSAAGVLWLGWTRGRRDSLPG